MVMTNDHGVEAVRGFWAPEEFVSVVAQDHDMGHSFGCHLQNGDACIGWLADQKRRDVPNIGLRLRLMTNEDELERFKRVDERDKRLFASVATMVRANVGKRFPRRNARAVSLLKKIGKEAP